MRNKYLSLILLLAITFLASFIGGFVTSEFKEPWYSNLILSNFSPPSWLFAPVWTTLYIFMSIAIWRVWQKTFEVKLLKVYLTHLFFNISWSIIFFGFHNILLALIDLVIIIILILFLMYLYKSRDKLSYYLMIPYLFWSSYALFLNFSILVLN
jgi:benzodiazapine receptor